MGQRGSFVAMSRRALVLFAAGALGVSLVGCSEGAPPTAVTGGAVPTESAPPSLLPIVVDSNVVDDTATLAPDTLFAGDPCTALAASDFTGVTFGGLGTGRLTDTQQPSDDVCTYVLKVGAKEMLVVVRARLAADFDQPAATDEETEVLSGIGNAARGVQHADSYEVFVQVDNGYFSVAAPDRGSARAMAKAAVKRALAG